MARVILQKAQGEGTSLPAALCCAIALCAPLGNAAEPEQKPTPPSQYSARLFTAINAYRVEHGAAELKRSANLDRLAEGHSRNMARAGRLSHEGFRERAMGTDSSACVENVGWNYATPEAQLRAWAGSPAHNANMLDSRVTQAGIGDAEAYVTFIACR